MRLLDEPAHPVEHVLPRGAGERTHGVIRKHDNVFAPEAMLLWEGCISN